ncbi:MAG: ABC transporter permease [Proteobacteria bacterium]|nr:ABC transporter permease [Pseudomonadota bacterium]
MALSQLTLPGSIRLYLMLGWRNLWRRPRRSLLTLFAIVLGLLLFILTRGIQMGTYEKIIEKAVRTNTGYVQIHKAGYRENHSFEYMIGDASAIEAMLEKEPAVAAFTRRITSEALIASDKSTTGTAVIGVDASREFEITTLKTRMKEGQLPSLQGDIMVGERMAKNLKVGLGDELILIGSGADGSLGADRYYLKGIFATGVADFDSSIAMIGIDDADRLFSMNGGITEIVIHLNDFNAADEVSDKLRSLLAGSGMEVHSWKELLPEMVQMITLDNIGGLVMLWFFFIIVIAVILNTILIATLERVKEFGIMMSLGLRPSQLFALIMSEAVVLVLTGTLIGLALSWAIGGYLEQHPFGLGESVSKQMEEQGLSPLIYTRITAGLLLSWGGAIFFTSMLAAVYPALKVSRLSPLKAMHPGRGEL